ncbi:formyltransferase family protein [Empedobacter falsenii]
MIGLFLMTEKGLEVINTIISHQYQQYVTFICIGKDKAVVKDYSKEIENICIANNIQYFFNNDKSTYPKVSNNIAISWRWILDVENLIVFHDSLLPKYRGFAPLVTALINGEKEIGVTALIATNEYDKGDIILQKKINITYPIKIEKAIKKISYLYGELILNIFEKLIINKELDINKQCESKATYSLWLDDKDYFIDWELDAEKIKRKVDACGFPYLNAKTMVDNRIISILDCEIVEDVVVENRIAGKVIFSKENKPVIVCGKGLLMIKEAYYNDNSESFIPLKKFRSRLI